MKRGSQTPTVYKYLATDEDLKRSKGKKAIDLYNETTKTAQEWQEGLLEQILAINEDGLYVHSKFGYSIPRRNGKSEVFIARTLYGLEEAVEKLLYTAHRATTSHDFFRRVEKALIEKGYIKANDIKKGDKIPNDKIFDSIKSLGSELITLRKTGASISFRTRTASGGLGEGFDVHLVDEAQEYTEEQESSLKYVVSDSPNPQTLMCGTPPTAVSKGDVFPKVRDNTLADKTKNTGWAEWSVDSKSDPYDVELWYQTNPSLGIILTERKIEDEIGEDLLDFNIQRLGWWANYNQASAIPDNVWRATMIDKLDKELLKSKLYIGIKFGKDGRNTALSIACKMQDDSIFIQALHCIPTVQGVSWITDLLGRLDYAEVVADGKNGQEMLEKAMREAKLKHLKFPTVAEVINANAEFEQGVFQHLIKHTEQTSLDQAVANCKKRAIGSNGGFGYESLVEEMDIALLDSVIYAYWSAHNAKITRAKPMIGY